MAGVRRKAAKEALGRAPRKETHLAHPLVPILRGLHARELLGNKPLALLRRSLRLLLDARDHLGGARGDLLGRARVRAGCVAREGARLRADG